MTAKTFNLKLNHFRGYGRPAEAVLVESLNRSRQPEGTREFSQGLGDKPQQQEGPQMTPEYLAGLFDGEGCFDVQTLYPQRGSGRYYCRPRIRMAMAVNALPLLEALHAKYGGHLVHRKSTKPNQQDSVSLEWLSQDAMLRLLDDILPSLILKREQGLLIKWWLENASGRQLKAFPGMEMARREFAEELRAMKRDPQRLSDRAAERLSQLMRQSDLVGDHETSPEMREALTA